jgi:hypothetical protein
VLLAGIVALNVATLSLTASAGTIAEDIATLEQENTTLQARLAARLSNHRVSLTATKLGLVNPPVTDLTYRHADAAAIATAARRLDAAG